MVNQYEEIGSDMPPLILNHPVTSIHWLVVVSPVYYKNVVFGVVSFPLCKNMWKLEDMMK